MKTSIKKIAVTPVKKVASKVVAKKAVVKKAVAKKSVSIPVKNIATKKVTAKKAVKAFAGKKLIEASNYNSFWMNDGQILNTLVALGYALKKMDTAVYKYHTANGRHDFANWVEDVLKDIDCATALRKNKTPKAAHATVVKSLETYSI